MLEHFKNVNGIYGIKWFVLYCSGDVFAQHIDINHNVMSAVQTAGWLYSVIDKSLNDYVVYMYVKCL